jgi:hypothetical protein
MTDTDIQYLSLGLNIILLVNNYIQVKRYESLYQLFGKTIQLVGAIADGKAMPKRDSEGNIRIKEIKNETN